jgi:hypothetical protein
MKELNNKKINNKKINNKKLNNKKLNNKIKQKGGNLCDLNNEMTYPTYNKGGTDGKLSTTFNDIWGVVRYSVGSLTSAGCLIADFSTLRTDIGKTFDEAPPRTAPTPTDTKI